MSKTISKSELDTAIAELDKVRDEWLKRPEVTGVDVGFKFKAGRMTDQLAIRVHVKRKLSTKDLPSTEIFPDQLGGFEVDVIEAAYGPHQGNAIEGEILKGGQENAEENSKEQS